MYDRFTPTVYEIKAEPADKGLRLDAFLAQKLFCSRAQVSKTIKAGLVTNIGATCKPAQKVSGDEAYSVVMPPPTVGRLEPQAIPLDIIFSDEHIAVVNKPVGLTVHPGAGVRDGTLCNALLYHFPAMNIGQEERPGIVHRLDKNTSGVMVVAKSPMAHQVLSDDFKYRRVKKVYRTLCVGEMIENRFELKTGHVRHPYNRLKFFTGLLVPKGKSSNVRMAHTSFEVICRRLGITELKATLHTGRTHQIRAHLADIDHPLIGDELYGGKKSWPSALPQTLLRALANLPGQALHAEVIEFAHPVGKQWLSFSAPLPEPLSTICNFLRA